MSKRLDENIGAVEYDGQVGYCMREFLEFSWYD